MMEVSGRSIFSAPAEIGACLSFSLSTALCAYLTFLSDGASWWNPESESYSDVDVYKGAVTSSYPSFDGDVKRNLNVPL